MAGRNLTRGMQLDALNLFIGYDDRTPCGAASFIVSALRRTTIPLVIRPLMRDSLINVGAYKRDIDVNASTGFAFTRFLAPYLCDYEGYSLFVDGADMVVKRDLSDLIGDAFKASTDFAVSVVQHPTYEPASSTKFWGATQHVYPRKNWSSVMFFNNAHPHCERLDPESVSEQPGAWLHRFEWTDAVGSLPVRWNILIDEPDWMQQHPDCEKDPGIVHYTRGIPGVPDYASQMTRQQRDLWFEEYEMATKLPGVETYERG